MARGWHQKSLTGEELLKVFVEFVSEDQPIEYLVEHLDFISPMELNKLLGIVHEAAIGPKGATVAHLNEEGQIVIEDQGALSAIIIGSMLMGSYGRKKADER